MRVKLLEERKVEDMLADAVKNPWEPKPWQKQMKSGDERFAHAAIRERQKVERPMIHGMKAWNMLSASVPDPRISNILLPLIRTICRVIISSLTVELPGYNYKPKSKDDEGLIELWKEANDDIDSRTGMMAEMEDFITNYIVTGNAAFEDRVETPYKFDRTWNGTDFTMTPRRDFSRPRISTVSRHPMEYFFATWCKDPNGRVPVGFRDFYTWNEFAEQIAECKLNDGSYKYADCEKVVPGYTLTFGDTQKPDFQQENHDGVAVITIQDPISNRNVKYANGILITRPDHLALSQLVKLQRPTLSIGRALHMYESNYRAPMAWGVGFPHILKGLDAFTQAIGNLTIDNWKQANTNVISVKNGLQSALNPDLSHISSMRIDGEVIVSPLGRANLADFGALKTMTDEFCIFLTGYDFRKLVGDLGKNTTAFAFEKRLEAESVETKKIVGHLENTCLLHHGQVRLDLIINKMTEEEYEDITDKEEMERIKKALGAKKAPKEDYEFDKFGNPVRKAVRETVRVRGKRIEEEYDDKGRRTRDGYRDRGKAEMDSEIPVVAAYFKPSDGKMPEVEVVGSYMHGLKNSLKFQKIQYLSNYARQRIAESAANPGNKELKTKFDAQKIDEEIVRATETPLESVMKEESRDDDKMTMEEFKKLQALSQPPNAQASVSPAAQAVQGVRDVPSGGFGTFGDATAASPINAAASAAGAP